MFPASTRWIYGAGGFRAVAAEHGLETLEALSSRCLGEVVTNHRSSWVRRWETRTNVYYVKTYDYPTWCDRARGVGRTTLFARSRPHREMQALAWLLGHGFEAPRVQGVVESRVLGALRRAVLVTEAWPGTSLDQLLPTLGEGDRTGLLAALAAFVRRLHAEGFRDRNLDLRNLLARPDDRGWVLAKIDSPRYRIVRAGHTGDAWATADWQRLTASLRAIGLEIPPGDRPGGTGA